MDTYYQIGIDNSTFANPGSKQWFKDCNETLSTSFVAFLFSIWGKWKSPQFQLPFVLIPFVKRYSTVFWASTSGLPKTRRNICAPKFENRKKAGDTKPIPPPPALKRELDDGDPGLGHYSPFGRLKNAAPTNFWQRRNRSIFDARNCEEFDWQEAIEIAKSTSVLR